MRRVQSRAAEHSGMEIARRGFDAHVVVAQAASRDVEDRHAAPVETAVEHDGRVRTAIVGREVLDG
jgi:hypothetical protein